jgi:Cytochrome oxidase complex assembly protein 1
MTDTQAVIAPEPIPPELNHWGWSTIIGIGVAVLFVGWFGSIFALNYMAMRSLSRAVSATINNSEPYRLGVAELQASPVAAAALGTPVAVATNGKLHLHSRVVSDGSGQASVTFPARGPKAKGTVFVEASRKDSVWTITRLTLKPDGSDREIDLIGAANKTPTGTGVDKRAPIDWDEPHVLG